ncbi:MAG: acyl-CoA dehydrogenase [Saprospiraceae bacterium]|nr:acyl-CoA dehydrogenase [Saprospiraceae bacterium]
MSRQYICMDTIRFLMGKVHPIAPLFTYDRYADFSEDEVDLLLGAAKDLADQHYFPHFKSMDEHGVVYDNGEVTTPPELGDIIRATAEGGWIGGTDKPENGGMNLPEMIFGTAQLIFQAANNSAQGYVGLTTGSARLITSFGSQELIDTYVPKMYAGQWQGTMALTEPQAGSSLSDIVTSATPVGQDGSYHIKGQKIFISAGQHQHSENFVHLTLARIDGAPAGTKGISLFVVPKFLPSPDGSLTYNHVFCAGDYQKMGQRGYATTHLVFGEDQPTVGFLVGEPNKGLRYMFQMMNEARIAVGQTAAGVASGAYYASLQYAKERPQGRALEQKKNLGSEQTLIINHPDVRRMLFTQKAVVEGSFSLAMECLKLSDLIHAAPESEKEDHFLLLDLLTPIMKTYPAEMGQKSVSMGLQVLGGYGFTMDFDLQQYYRDIRIMAIYEGTTGIQSLDLLGRKMTIKNGKAAQLLMAAVQRTIHEASTYDELKPQAQQLGKALERMGGVVQHLMPYAMRGELTTFLADATLFMEMAGHVVIGWQWLKMALQAKQDQLSGNDQFADAFYESKVQTMQFFFRYELPKTVGLHRTLTADSLPLTIGQVESALI